MGAAPEKSNQNQYEPPGLCYTKDMLVAIDTGGTKTLVTSFTRDGKMGEELRFPTPKDPTEYVSVVKKTLKQLYGNREEQVEAIVVGIPGMIKNGVAIWCQNLEWKNVHIQEALKGALGDAPVLIENDANLAGLAEARSLSPTPPFVLYVTVSTGIGTGIITDGHIDPDLKLSEGGRMLVEFDGRVREWETFASGKAIYNTYSAYARDITSKRIWNQIADRISRGFLAMIPVLQPDVIVIGGSIGTYFDHYGPQLTKRLNEHLPAHIPTPPIRAAQHPEQAVIYGCYYYALDYLATH